MNFYKLFVLFACLFFNTCATISKEAIDIRSNPNFFSLSDVEKNLVEKIIGRVEDHENKLYYFNRLSFLLNTASVAPESVGTMNRKRVKESVEEVKETRKETIEATEVDFETYVNMEEAYEVAKKRNWKGYRPEWYSPYFYIADDSPTDLLVHIQVALQGDEDLINDIMFMEDSVEKQLSIPGFNVNLVFVGRSGEDVFEVNADPTQWPTSLNWSGGVFTIAHELMHLMGLPDEYDLIESHAGNKFLPIETRLRLFLQQLDVELPQDATEGIMCFSWKLPLQRHVCAAVGLEKDCVKKRIKAFN